MYRATSAAVYGPSWISLSRTPARRSPRAYGLRTATHPTGYAPAYGERPRKRRPTVDPVTNLQSPSAAIDDDAPVRRYTRTDTTDYAAERHLVSSISPIRMGEMQ